MYHAGNRKTIGKAHKKRRKKREKLPKKISGGEKSIVKIRKKHYKIL